MTATQKTVVGVTLIGVIGGPGALLLLFVVGAFAGALALYVTAAVVGVMVLGWLFYWLVERFAPPPEGSRWYYLRAALGLWFAGCIVVKLFTVSFGGGLVLSGLIVALLIGAGLSQTQGR